MDTELFQLVMLLYITMVFYIIYTVPPLITVLLQQYYPQHTHTRYQSSKDPTCVDYMAFSDEIESIFTTKNLEKMPTTQVHGGLIIMGMVVK